MLAGLGAGLDFTHVAPAVSTPSLQPASAFWAVAPSLTPFVAVERSFGRISVAVAAGAEIHLLDERYAVKTATDTRNVFVPARVRPQIEALDRRRALSLLPPLLLADVEERAFGLLRGAGFVLTETLRRCGGGRSGLT